MPNTYLGDGIRVVVSPRLLLSIRGSDLCASLRLRLSCLGRDGSYINPLLGKGDVVVAGIPVALSNCIGSLVRNVGISKTVGSRLGFHMSMTVGQDAVSSCNLSCGLVYNGRVRHNLGCWLSFSCSLGIGWGVVVFCQCLDGGIYCS